MDEQPFHPDDGQEIAQSCYRRLCDLVELLREARQRNDDRALDCAFDGIHASALRVEVRSAWMPIGVALVSAEFRLTLRGCGASVRLIGILDQYAEPAKARLQYRSWRTTWTDWTGAHEAQLLEYARAFAFA